MTYILCNCNLQYLTGLDVQSLVQDDVFIPVLLDQMCDVCSYDDFWEQKVLNNYITFS